MVVFASAKDRRSTVIGAKLHTNFKLSSAGEYLGLYHLAAAPAAVSELNFPEQRNNYSFGFDRLGNWVYFPSPTPGEPNGDSLIVGVVAPVQFSVESGVFDSLFTLELATATSGATIRYTTDGTEPTPDSGVPYSGALAINSTTIIRAAAFKANSLSSPVSSRTYLFGIDPAIGSLPIMSIVINPADYSGPTGIMGIKGGEYEWIDNDFSSWRRVRSSDYFNPSNVGIQWERPISLEVFGNYQDRFQVGAGIRVHGSESSRLTYEPDTKIPFGIFFRGDYGVGKLEYPLIPNSPLKSFDSLVLRAGHNDRVNPFITDELMRQLFSDMGQASMLGTFVSLFLNGEYKGYYNPTERIDEDWVRARHGGRQSWDIITPYSNAQQGDSDAWWSLLNYVQKHDLTEESHYREVASRLDLVNFADYLLINIYGDTHDWTENNWRAARERVSGGRFRFYVWDAEFALGIHGYSVQNNTLTDAEGLGNSSEISTLFKHIKRNEEFKLLFADRVRKHLFEGGALSSVNVLKRYQEFRQILSGVIPNMETTVPDYWVPERKRIILEDFVDAGLYPPLDAPTFSHHGGNVSPGFTLTMSSSKGEIHYTLNGGDPRVPFSGSISSEATLHVPDGTIPINSSAAVKARSWNGDTWSALSEAVFKIDEPDMPLRITEVMYHPVEGEGYEFIELYNVAARPLDLSGIRVEGVGFSFPSGTTLAGNGVLVLCSDPVAFTAKHPGIQTFGPYSGTLANSGERLAVKDPNGQTHAFVDYDDEGGWPASPDGEGPSLEIIDPRGDPNDPTNWRASLVPGGSPGRVSVTSPDRRIRFHEIMADTSGAGRSSSGSRDWIELFNPGTEAVDLGGWIISDDANTDKFLFPEQTILEPGNYLVIWCDEESSTSGFHSGFSVNQKGETLFLYDPLSNRVDTVRFGLQVPNYSLGQMEGKWQLTRPTPGQANVVAELGSPSTLVINEWLADSAPGTDDWLELYSRDPVNPVSLQGLRLILNGISHELNDYSFVGPAGYARFRADEKDGADHLDFKLPASGGTLRLVDSAGTEIDRIIYSSQAEGTSEGRLPDGNGQIAAFVSSSSPGESNYLPLDTVVINEVLSHTDNPLEDAIELYNPTSSPVNIGGWYLSDSPKEFKKFRISEGTVIPPGGYRVFCEFEFNASLAGAASAFSLSSSEGDSVYLSVADGAGNLTGTRTAVHFGAAENGVSFGPITTTQGADFVALSRRTFGVDNPDSLEAFRTGAGLTNAALKVGPVVITEIMYQPPSTDGNPDHERDVFIELCNITPNPVLLSDPEIPNRAWKIGNGVEFTFPKGSLLYPGSCFLVVCFDPNTDEAALNAFRSRYNLQPNVLVLGPYEGKLSNSGESIELYKPDTPQNSDHTNAGFIPYILVDKVKYSSVAPWPAQSANGQGSSIQRCDLVAYGNEPANWKADPPTPGLPNVLGGADTDGDGLPDMWETIHSLNPYDPSDAGVDSDGDGLRDREEYIAGTDLYDPSNSFKLQVVSVINAVAVLEFVGVAGKSYSLLHRPQDLSGPWLKLLDIEPQSSTRKMQINDTLNHGEPARFYRLVTPASPDAQPK